MSHQITDDLIDNMMGPPDDTEIFSRARLAQLGGFQSQKHVRWTKGPEPLLSPSKLFSERDLALAVMLDELWKTLHPSVATAAWRAVRREILGGGERLDVIVELSTRDAQLATSDEEIGRLLPRATEVVVVPLAGRVRRARQACTRFRGTEGSDVASGRANEE